MRVFQNLNPKKALMTDGICDNLFVRTRDNTCSFCVVLCVGWGGVVEYISHSLSVESTLDEHLDENKHPLHHTITHTTYTHTFFSHNHILVIDDKF